jgi:hypothetical protein
MAGEATGEAKLAGRRRGLAQPGSRRVVVGGAETRRASLFFFREERKKTHLWIGRGDDAHQNSPRIISEGLPKRLGARSMFFSLFEGGRLELTRHNDRNRLAPVSLYVVTLDA